MRVAKCGCASPTRPPMHHRALGLGIIETAQNGIAPEVRTASTNLRTLDLQDEDDRETVLRELRALERELLGDD